MLHTYRIHRFEWNPPMYAFSVIFTWSRSYSGWVITTQFFQNQKYTLRAFQWRIERCSTTYSHILHTHNRSSVFNEILPYAYFQLLPHARWVIQDELLLPRFLKIKKYTFRAFKWRVARYRTTSNRILNTYQIPSIKWNPPICAFWAISTRPMSYSGWVIIIHIFENQKICIPSFPMTCRTLY